MTSPISDWALIIHADSGDTRVDVYWVDIRAGRLGLQLAREVKAWRKRDDLLTLGQRFRVVDAPAPIVNDNYADQQLEADESIGGRDSGDAPAIPVESLPPSTPDPLPLVPVVPQDSRRVTSRREYLRGRVRAVLAHSETAGKALQRGWPTGVPGLAVDQHDMHSLDAIQDAIIRVETDHSVPWFPEWDDPDRESSKANHPSNWVESWANPANAKPDTGARLAIQQGIVNHPRQRLVSEWIATAMRGNVNPDIDTTATAHALYEFAMVDVKDWPDDDLTIMLEGCLRTLGYPNGISDLGNFDPVQAPVLMSCAFAIAAGNATLLFSEDGSPSVIIDVIAKPL